MWLSLGIVMEVLYGEVEKVLRGVVEVDAVLFVAEEVAGPDISDKGSEVLPASMIPERGPQTAKRKLEREKPDGTTGPTGPRDHAGTPNGATGQPILDPPPNDSKPG